MFVRSAIYLDDTNHQTQEKERCIYISETRKALLKANAQGVSSVWKSLSLIQSLLFFPICPSVCTHLSEYLRYQYITSLIRQDHLSHIPQLDLSVLGFSSDHMNSNVSSSP